jgi:hypothetical protein
MDHAVVPFDILELVLDQVGDDRSLKSVTTLAKVALTCFALTGMST